jgi:hypoxanthine-guanine phosphoribosyltransferase
MKYIMGFLKIQNPEPASIKILVLGWKKVVTQVDFEPDYYAFELSPEWVVGEGMDSNQGFRNLKGIWQKIV